MSEARELLAAIAQMARKGGDDYLTAADIETVLEFARTEAEAETRPFMDMGDEALFAIEAERERKAAKPRPCTCHPDDNPPVPGRSGQAFPPPPPPPRTDNAEQWRASKAALDAACEAHFAHMRVRGAGPISVREQIEDELRAARPHLIAEAAAEIERLRDELKIVRGGAAVARARTINRVKEIIDDNVSDREILARLSNQLSELEKV